MKVYYRISDNSYRKEKIPGTSKEICLKSLLRNFPSSEKIIICDNCNKDTIEMVERVANNCNIIKTNFSNAGSFDYSFDLALENDCECINYFAEDDYVYNINSMQELAIKEGLEKVEYVTLFDHPDKYESEYSYGETCKVFKTNNFLWRTTISTCMTFASKTKNLKKNLAIFKRYLTNQVHPNDHCIFTSLKERGNSLALPLPGLAFHTDLTYLIQKNSIHRMIDPWVFESVQFELFEKLKEKDPNLSNLELDKRPNFKTLIMLDSFIKM